MATSTGGSAPKKDLCLLVLDGGGVRGLSMLLILKRLMEGIDPLNPPRPCDYFDMIGGTSTGGLIALMLGRMKMTVDECIKAYSALAPSIFTHIRHRIKLSNGETQGRFDHDAMESGIKELLSQNAIDSESLLKASVVEDCKTFVCATSRATAQTVVLSSYYNERRGSDLLNSTKIWEAARATSAATTFFEPITISDETFVDGATGANNPIQHMWSEAADVWGLQDNQLENNIKCLVSIGTGIPSLEAFGPGLKDVARALKSIALETEATAGIFRKHHTQLFQSDKAFRFNVVRGLENIGLEEASQLGAIKAATRNYVQMEEVLVDIKKCASNLQEREWLSLIETHILKAVESDISDLNDEDSHSTKDDLQWLKHTRDYETWKERGFGLLWYQGNRHRVLPSRKSVGAALAHLQSRKYSCFAGPQLGAGRELSRALYVQCDKSERSDNLDTSEDSQIPCNEVMWSLIYQLLLMDCKDSMSFQRRLMQIGSRERAFLLQRVQGRENKITVLILELLVGLLQATQSLDVLAIDNAHLIDGTSYMQTFLGMIQNETPKAELRFPAFITGTPRSYLANSSPFSKLLTVQDNTEREECLQSLYFPEWNARRDQVIDAETKTNNWIWSNKGYQRWKESESGVLWVEGKPGSGKSVLAKTLQRRLSPTSLERNSTGLITSTDGIKRETASPMVRSNSSGHMVADWFFNSRGGEIGIAHAAFLQSILYQLLYQNEDLFKVAAPYYRQRSPHPENEWDAQTLRGLLNEISATGLPMVCIVDAMDETHALVNDPKICKTCRPRSIMYLLTTLIYDIQQSKMKFIVLSRPDPVIEMDFVGFQSCCLDAYRIVLELENKNDINMVIDRGLESLRESLHAYESEEEPKLKNAKPRKYKGLGIVKSMQVASKEETSLKSIRSYLKDNADGVILWVTLILQELSDHASGGLSTFAELDNLMRGLPRKLDMFYEYIIDKIQKQQSPEELAKTRMILILIAGSVTILPISLREMWEALAVPIDVKAALKSTMDPIVENLIPIKSWVGFRRLLRRKCGPLIEVVPLRRTPRHILDQGDDTDIGPDDILQFIHRTVKDFFNSPARKGYLHFSDQDARDETTAIAKRYIQITFPDEETLYGPPIPAKPRSSWKTNIRDYVDYLEKRNFLSLAKNMLCQTETAQVTTLGIYASIDKLIYLPRDPETSLYIDAKNARRIVGKNILFYPACTPTFDRGRGGSVESPVLGQAVRYACANGFVVAMRNMMIITQLHGETLLQDYAIYNGALVACIEAGQLDQIQSLTRRQRHQYQYLHGTKHIPRWPVGSYVESAHLDPFIQLAIQSGQEEIVEFLFNHTDHYYARQNAVIDFAVTKEDIRADDDRPGYFDPFLRSLSDVAEPSKRAAETSKSGILGMMNNLKKAFKSSFNRKHRTAGRPSWLEPKLPRSSNSSGSLDSLDQVQSSDELDVPKFTRTQVEAGFPGVSFGKPKDLDIVPSESDSKEPRPAPDLACVLDLHFENDSEAFLDFNDLDDLPLPAVETHRPKRDSTEIENSANRSGHTRPGEKDPDESDREVLIQPRRHDPAGIEHERKEFLELKIFCLEMAREKRKSRSDRDISVDEIREAIQLVIDAMVRALAFFLWVSLTN
ncbi:hypothetical protein N7526_003352 [Penicillium atrosanguineum]|nr:hypothetical protein N7526_003352 [Penicillium atrosanguineum]